MHDQGSAAAGGEAFWTDDEYDREHASDGVSRYGHYVRSAARSGLMAECWDGTWDDDQVRRVRFACAAWETASSPVMAPGYIRRHPRVLSGRVEYCAWDGTLTGRRRAGGAVAAAAGLVQGLAGRGLVAGLADRVVVWRRAVLPGAGRGRGRVRSVPDDHRQAGVPAAARRAARRAVRPAATVSRTPPARPSRCWWRR